MIHLYATRANPQYSNSTHKPVNYPQSQSRSQDVDTYLSIDGKLDAKNVDSKAG